MTQPAGPAHSGSRWEPTPDATYGSVATAPIGRPEPTDQDRRGRRSPVFAALIALLVVVAVLAAGWAARAALRPGFDPIDRTPARPSAPADPNVRERGEPRDGSGPRRHIGSGDGGPREGGPRAGAPDQDPEGESGGGQGSDDGQTT